MTDAMDWGLVHREMLEHVVRGRIYTWAGEPLRRGVEEGHARFDREHRQAFVDLQHGGLVCGEHLTSTGYQAADTWGLNPDEHLKGLIH
jgi:hypothetical protein